MWNNEKYQVLISSYNAEMYLPRCFESLEESMKGRDWILLFANDDSTDHTFEALDDYASVCSAKNIHYYTFDKAKNVNKAKNRLFKECLEFGNEYPAILFMDADDEMLPERPNLIKTAKREQAPFVVGAWEKIYDVRSGADGTAASRTKQLGSHGMGKHKLLQENDFGIWATLIHASLIPKDGKFLFEGVYAYGDILSWYYWDHIKGIKPIVHNSDEYVHRYYNIEGSVSNPRGDEERILNINIFKGFRDKILKNVDIYKECSV